MKQIMLKVKRENIQILITNLDLVYQLTNLHGWPGKTDTCMKFW